MKNVKSLAVALLIGAIPIVMNSQNVGISPPPGSPPDPSAGLDVNFSNKGILIPRVALTSPTDMATIPSPATSLLVYNTSSTSGLTPGYYYWDGSKWVKLLITGTPSDAWLTTGNVGTSPSTHFIGTIDNTSLVFRTNNTEQMRLHFSGQLSIGDNTPGGKLDVHQTSSNDVARFTTYGNVNSILLRRTQGTKTSPSSTSGANTVLGRFDAQGYDGSGFTTAARIEMATDATGGTSSDMPGRITFWTTPDNSGTIQERMRITNNGNVGIGTTTPATKLDVAGRVQISNQYDNVFAATEGTRVFDLIGTYAGWDPDAVYIAGYNAINAPGVRATNKIFFVGNPSERMVINLTTGNVGIGTTNPATRLHLNSNSGSTTLRITSPASNYAGIQVGATDGWYFGAEPSEDFVINRDVPLGSGTNVFTIFASVQPRMSRFRRNSGVSGNGSNNDGPTNVIIESGNGTSRYNDWPNGWGGGLSTWDICGAATFMNNYYSRSDRSYKKNIKELTFEELKDKFMALKPVQYYINSEELKVDDPDRLRFGFIANDVEKIFPNLVINAGMLENIKRGLEYDGIIPILVKIVQEQQKKIEYLERKIETLESHNQK